MSDNADNIALVTAEGSLRDNVDPNVLCISYVNEFSVGKSSLQDLAIGIASKAVACNNIILNKTPNGSYGIVTCQDASGKKLDKCVIGIIDEMIDASTIWRDYARATGQERTDHVWKYGRKFTPITPILSIAILKSEFEIPRTLFNSRLCGYGKGFAGIVRQIVERYPL